LRHIPIPESRTPHSLWLLSFSLGMKLPSH